MLIINLCIVPLAVSGYLSYLEELLWELWPIIRSSLEMLPFMENELLGRLCCARKTQEKANVIKEVHFQLLFDRDTKEYP